MGQYLVVCFLKTCRRLPQVWAYPSQESWKVGHSRQFQFTIPWPWRFFAAGQLSVLIFAHARFLSLAHGRQLLSSHFLQNCLNWPNCTSDTSSSLLSYKIHKRPPAPTLFGNTLQKLSQCLLLVILLNVSKWTVRTRACYLKTSAGGKTSRETWSSLKDPISFLYKAL